MEKNVRINKKIGFNYTSAMKFKTTNKVKGAIFSSNFVDNVSCLALGKNDIHYLQITSHIIRYPHRFCNLKVRENRNQISAIAYNLFGFDFFFFLKDLCPGSWTPTNITSSGIQLLNKNFTNIANQVKFVDTKRYYQQSLAVLASTMTEQGRLSIKESAKKSS